MQDPPVSAGSFLRAPLSFPRLETPSLSRFKIRPPLAHGISSPALARAHRFAPRRKIEARKEGSFLASILPLKLTIKKVSFIPLKLCRKEDCFLCRNETLKFLGLQGSHKALSVGYHDRGHGESQRGGG